MNSSSEPSPTNASVSAPAGTCLPTVTVLSCFMFAKTPVPRLISESGSTTSATLVPENAPLPMDARPSLSSSVFRLESLANASDSTVFTLAGSFTLCRRAPLNAALPMVVKLEGRPSATEPEALRTLILLSAEHASNAFAPMVSTLSDSVTLESWMQFSNALAGMEVTPSGSTTRCTEEVENASEPMDATPSGSSISASPWVPKNARSPMPVSLLPDSKRTLPRLCVLLNASLPMEVTLYGMETL